MEMRIERYAPNVNCWMIDYSKDHYLMFEICKGFKIRYEVRKDISLYTYLVRIGWFVFAWK